MKIKLIGTGSMYTSYNSACTLVNNNLLIDIPNGTVKQLLKMNFDLTNIKTILITHFHGDHTADIPFFLKYVYVNDELDTPVTIIGPKGIKNKILELFNAYNFESEETINKLFKINFIEILESQLQIDDYNINSFEVLHGLEKPALGYIINNKLGLTGDCGLCSGVETIFNNSDTIISDSSLKIGDEGHLGIDNLKYLITKYNKRVIATHLRDSTRQELLNTPVSNLNVVEDGFEFEL